MAFDANRFDVLGVPVDAVTMSEAVALVSSWIERREPNFACFRDVHGVMLCQDDPVLREVHKRAGLVAPDGMPLVWLGRLAGHRTIRRVCGPDFMLEFCSHSAEKGYRHFLYGGRDGVAEQLAARLQDRFPGLQIVGTYTPPFRLLTPQETEEVAEKIAQSRADVVWVGLSTPKQERWMSEQVGRLKGPVLLGVGAAFDFHAGLVKRPPRWIQRTGFEWLYRLIIEPRRLWRRYLVLGPQFMWLLLLGFTGRHFDQG